MDFWRQLATWFIVFLIYSFAGWLIEMVITLLRHRKICDRGFLIGPICPIYGIGAVVASWLFSGIDNLALIFVLSMISGGLLEYFTSFYLEAFFHVRWWDYHYLPFNLNGRTCLSVVLTFGVFGIIIVRFITPALISFLGTIDSLWLYLVAGFCCLLMIIDVVLSLVLILHFRVTAGIVGNDDATAEISENIRDVMMRRSKLDGRLVKAFPNMKASPQPTRSRKTRKKS